MHWLTPEAPVPLITSTETLREVGAFTGLLNNLTLISSQHVTDSLRTHLRYPFEALSSYNIYKSSSYLTRAGIAPLV
jgi:hypothetical protein